MGRLTEIWAHPWQRRGVIAFIVVLLYGAAGFLLAPWIVERTLVSTLAERLSLETRVGNLSINPFSLSLKIDDLAVVESDGQTLLSFDRFYVNFQLSSLFRWAWSFNEIHLISPYVHFERLTETDSNLTELAARWVATAAPEATQQAPDQQEASGIPRLTVADLRIIEGQVTVSDQARAVPFSTDLAPIDLALADFSTLPETSGRQQVTIRTESGAEVGLTGTLSVNPLSLDGHLRLEGTYTPTLFRYFRDELALPLTFDGGAVQAQLDYRIAMDAEDEMTVALSGLTGTLSGLNVNQPEHPHLVELGLLSLESGSLSWPGKIVRIERLAVDDLLLRLFRDADGSYLPGRAAPAGGTASTTESATESTAEESDDSSAEDRREEGIEAVADDAGAWQVEVAEIALNRGRIIHTDTTLDDGAIEIPTLNLTLQDFALAPGREMPINLDLALLPGGTVRLDGTVQLFPEVRLTSVLTVEGLALAAGQPYLSSVANIGIDDGSLSLGGNLAIGGEQSLLYQGNLEIDGLSLLDRVQEEALFAWQTLTVDQLTLTTKAVELSVLSIDQPYARVEIERDGTTNIERTFVPTATEEGADTPAEAPAAQPAGGAGFGLTIGETRITGGSANFTDLALPLPFQADISSIDGKLSTFATGSSAPSEVDITGQINEYGALNIEGSISANDPTAATDITVDFDNVNMPRMTPYTVKFAGRAIADGRTDLTLSYRLDAGALEGNNRLVIRDLTLGEKVEQPGAMDLPLDMAVALLKDGEGNVDFSFPVTGSIDDPEFSYSGAVMKAFSNVIGGIVAAPFRLLGSLVGMAPDELEHIGFEPGEATIAPPQRETLAKLAEALGQRPQLVLEVAPVRNTAADQIAIAERALDLEIDALMQAQPDDQSHTEALRTALENLYDAESRAVTRDVIATEHSSADEEGELQLDVPAYNLALRQSLIDAREVPEQELNALAQGRLDAIQEALTTLVSLPEARVRALPIEEVDLNEDGLVQMSLNVTIAD